MKRFSLVAVSVLGLMVAIIAGCSTEKKDAVNRTGSSAGEGDQPMVIAAIPKCTGGEFWETVEQGLVKNWLKAC